MEKKPKELILELCFLRKRTGFSVKFPFGKLRSSGSTPALGTSAVNSAFFLVCFVAHYKEVSAQGFLSSLPALLPPSLSFFLEIIFYFSFHPLTVVCICFAREKPQGLVYAN